MSIQSFIAKTNIKYLFLIDAIGALLSAFLLGVVLTRYESVFGMPVNTLYVLSFFPCIFVLYDYGCYLFTSSNSTIYLKIIAFANLGYCVLSVAYLIHHFQKLTYLGLIYFFLEIIIVIILAGFELKVANAKVDKVNNVS